ncbi:hypothetical protein B0A49_08347 [Cryomyces minteri]|uniref:DnaJ homologue subfamily C member 28 conserved domain-containing protein n=1 Tax=Cryomyces minteri TaxID=331657 RepID=A0A4U0WSN1_9PEZI|nr:hypothetical protein B0A49_08347 [Cryomyces minteri]
MSRRLAQMSDESLEVGGRSARRAVEEAGFDEDLKRRLEERIAGASTRNDYPSAFAQAELPTSAGKGTRDIAGARPWTGTESVEDAALRMLTDAHKPMRGPAKIPSIRGPPPKVDTGRSRTKVNSGTRIANARHKTSIYSFMKDPNLSEKEREQFRKEMKERFTPAARAIPATVQGLASLADERIVDAIARGQLKNLPRGKVIERDYNASSPFLDTTEYFINKIIQKQDIVPPWIEKQQELVSTATKFRSRLRADWRRHAARTISSRGGTLPDRIRRAQEYAAAEAIENPPKRKEEKMNAVDGGGHVSQITLSGELKPTEGSSATESTSQITVTEATVDPSGGSQHPEPGSVGKITITETTRHEENAEPHDARPSVRPFRDPAWEQMERSYHKVAIDNLNNLTRSYNLMAPNLAKKPYFSLDRELRACYADVAPQLASEIRDRANAPKLKIEVIGHTPGGVLERFGGQKVKVYDSRKPQYGFKEFWKDLFGGDGSKA